MCYHIIQVLYTYVKIYEYKLNKTFYSKFLSFWKKVYMIRMYIISILELEKE